MDLGQLCAGVSFAAGDLRRPACLRKRAGIDPDDRGHRLRRALLLQRWIQWLFASFDRGLSSDQKIKEFPPTGKRGRPRQPVVEPHPELVYAQLVKEKKQGRLKSLTTRICCGAERLARLGLKISTSLIGRVNLTFRQALAPLARKSLSFCKDRVQLRRRVVFFQVFYNFARPHQSLRLPLPELVSPATGLIRPKWQARTPGMAARLTDLVWSFRELLTAKFEPVLNQSNSG